jgi:hypothetical protein
MQESGAFLLRAMQNEDMPRLDLLVRESVQNALDAANERQPGGEVRIDFVVRTHATESIASLFSDGLNLKALRSRYPAGGKLLEIRDTLTEGLTGPLSFDEVGDDGTHGNLLKLVFEIGRTRSDEGAGGSWGLGKTCYFRMGAGLIIYYSRVKYGERYQERLIASLVEDESRPDRLQQDTRTGIGWWGAESELRPLTRTAQVHHVLAMLGIAPFGATETGTSIIIPFLRDDLLPGENRDDAGALLRRPPWYSSYESYIRVALARWFCARLDNPLFATGPRLTAAVNGNVVRSRSMLPVFRVAQALYNRAAQRRPGDGDYLEMMHVPADAVLQKAVAPRTIFVGTGPAGHVAAALLTPEQLGMDEPENYPDPSMCVFGSADTAPPYRPLVTFMRRPGMCVCWEDSTESRGWAGGLPGAADGRYLIAVFVPLHDRVLALDERRQHAAVHVTLETYLRGCERADHAAWRDVSGLKVVERIRTNCGRILRDFGSRAVPGATVTHAIRMARNLADLVLPERGMGTDGRTGRPTPPRAVPTRQGTGGRTASRAPVLEILEVRYGTQDMQVFWSLVWGSAEQVTGRRITLGVDSENGSIMMRDWQEGGLGPFPFRVVGAELMKEAGYMAGEVRIGSDEQGGVLLELQKGNAPAAVRGMLTIRHSPQAAGTLRPVLLADVVGSSVEKA